MDPIVSAACNRLAEGKGFVLATIIHQQGSAPRTAGTRMLITPELEIVGTIGGGLLEAGTMQAAAGMDAQATARILKFDLSNQVAAEMEMICGGLVKVLLDYIRPDKENLAIFEGWRESLSQSRKAALISIVTGDETNIQRIDHALLASGDRHIGRLDLSRASLENLADRLSGAAYLQVMNLDSKLVVADPGQRVPALYIFGAGHVARPTAHLAALAGFGVVVLDDRSEFADPAYFPDAVSVNTIAGFDEAFKDLSVHDNAYVVIVTRGHLHDRVVLAQALRTPAAYIGMIGSRRKKDAVYRRLRQEGFTDADLARVHSPIGLAIGADTPEEIAVSIVAEMIAVRAGVTP